MPILLKSVSCWHEQALLFLFLRPYLPSLTLCGERDSQTSTSPALQFKALLSEFGEVEGVLADGYSPEFTDTQPAKNKTVTIANKLKDLFISWFPSFRIN
jgi:hypothetical protein